MCGITGLYAYHYAANPIDVKELRCIRDHMAARGPDGQGEWLADDGRIGLGHRRLAIIDLSDGGTQPMASADGKYVVTYNGEIYNYRELRERLESSGCVFRTASDTEVLLHLYAQKGEAMVHDLRGMFAFGLWDAEKQALLLARDPYGIKPLFYADDGWTFRFASQVKALAAGRGIDLDPDPAGWAGFFLFGSVPEPHTTYRAVRCLAAGSVLWVDRCGVNEPRTYFSIARTLATAEWVAVGPPQDAQAQIRAALLDSVRHHLVADVPVGIFLSSGVDSGSLLGLALDCGRRHMRAITLDYEEHRDRAEDEAHLAGEVARHYGAEHAVRTVTRTEFCADLPKILDAMDQPTIDGVNTWFVSKAANEHGLKAAISGVGGDELVGGYPSFKDIPRWVRWVRPSRIFPPMGDVFRRLMTALSDFLPTTHPKASGFFKYAKTYSGAYLLRRGVFMPWELRQLMDEDFIREGLRRLDPLRHIRSVLDPQPKSAWGKVAALESALYLRNQLLRDADWASMAHSLEVRLPLVDATLLQRVGAIFGSLQQGAGKRLLANSPSRALPVEISRRAKTGFTTPINSWLTGDEALRSWQRIPLLRSRNCPWARRWAYQVAQA